MGFSRQEYWSGLPRLPPGDLADPGIQPVSLTSDLYWQAGSLSLAPPMAKHGWLVHVVWYVLKMCLLKNIFQSTFVNVKL